MIGGPFENMVRAESGLGHANETKEITNAKGADE